MNVTLQKFKPTKPLFEGLEVEKVRELISGKPTRGLHHHPIVAIVDRYTRAEADARFAPISVVTGGVEFITDGSDMDNNTVAFVLSGTNIELTVRDENGDETILETWGN